MAQVIQKYESGGETKQPNLYKRVNEDVDLDAYINEATKELRRRLPQLKEKERAQVQQEFSRMVKGMYDGTFTYRPGGGWTNTIGITNDPKPKGFDALGIAAGILGDVLRDQNAYVAPEVKPDTTAPTYNGVQDIGIRVLKNLVGPTGRVQYFINQDPLGEDKKRGHTNRLAMLKAELENYYNSDDAWKDTGASANQIKEWRDLYTKLGGIDPNNNGLIDDNEYLALSKLLGTGDLEALFYTGDQYTGSTTPAAQATQETRIEQTSPDFVSREDWYQANHPRSNSTQLFNRQLTTTGSYNQVARQKLRQILSAMDDKKLLNLVQIGLNQFSPNGTELNRGDTIIRGFNLPNGQMTNFQNNYIISEALEVLRGRGSSLHQFAENSNDYYIPFDSQTFDKKGTGLVYRISPTGPASILELDRNDIPYFTNQWDKDYFAVYKPSMKNGGVIRKFAPGGKWYSSFSDFDSNGYTANYNLDRLVNPDDFGNPWVSKKASAVDKGRYLPSEGNNRDYMTRIEQSPYFQEYMKALFDENHNLTEVGQAWAKQTDALLPENSLARIYDEKNQIRGSWTTTVPDVYGNNKETITYDNLYDYAMHNLTDQIKGGRHNVHLKEGNKYFYKDEEGKVHWVNPDEVEGYTTNLARQGWNADKTTYWNYYELTGPKEDGSQAVEPQPDAPAGDGSNGSPGEGDSNVNEEYLGVDPMIGKTPNMWLSELTPDLIGAGRLWASLHANKRVYNTILPSLKPVLKNTYERYSPVTGAFSAMQLKNRQGAETLSQSYKPFTSDASLAAARMLEGQRHANQLQAEGFLMDDQEIKRTQGEALMRQEDNMARRSDVANFNRASINQTNRERAQLKATRINRDWQSWDNFLQGIESRMRLRNEENRTKVNDFYDRLDAEQAESWYNTVMEPANRELDAWSRANPTADISTWNQWRNYNRHKAEARKMANSMLYGGMSRRYGLGYTNPYNDESYNAFRW